MIGLLWFKGITWDTSVREIGWMWVLLVVGLVFLIKHTISFIKELRSDDW